MFFDHYSDELKQTLDQIDRADIEKLEAYLERVLDNVRRTEMQQNNLKK